MRRRNRVRWALGALFSVFSLCIFAQETEEDLRARILAAAAKYRGVPYMYGAESPKAFDCSGFVRYVYREAAGIVLPRSSRGIFAAGFPVDPKKAKPGDVFIYDTVGGAPSHVALHLGDGSVIHAVSEGPRTGVIVSSASDSYFPRRLIAARSFLGSAAAAEAQSQAQEKEPQGTPAGVQSKPAASPKPGAPSTESSGAADAAPDGTGAPEEAPAAFIGFDIPAVRTTFTDRIPAAAGTKLVFMVTNRTGKDGTFVVIFYRNELNFRESREIHREKARIPADGSLELPAYQFEEPGQYKLIVKDNWNTQLLERIFTVRER